MQCVNPSVLHFQSSTCCLSISLTRHAISIEMVKIKNPTRFSLAGFHLKRYLQVFRASVDNRDKYLYSLITRNNDNAIINKFSDISKSITKITELNYKLHCNNNNIYISYNI